MAGITDALGAIAPEIGLGLGILQTGIGIIDKMKAKREMKKYLAKQKAYQTPDEIIQILNATQANAQSGYDSQTLNYLTGQTDQAFAGGIGAINRMGGDANDLSALFGQKVNAIMKIGSDNHQMNMQNFTQYLTALGSMADSKAAEQKSRNDINNNYLQAAGMNMQTSTGNISGGLNTVLSSLSAAQIANLYNPDGTLKNKKSVQGYYGTQAGSILPDNGLPMGNY